MKRRTIQVFEHEKLGLTLNSREECLDQNELDKILQFNDVHGNKYFTGIRNGIKFTSYVGVIQVGNLTLEILPKADKSSDADRHKWKNVLVDMLKVCNKINVESISESHLNKRNQSILELYFDIFLNEVEGIVRRGLVKKYRYQKGNTTALKGRLLFPEHIRKNLIHQERFYTESQVFDQEMILNQILLLALQVLKRINHSVYLIDRIERLTMAFPEMSSRKFTISDFDRIRLNRKTQPYKEALKIAQLIILQYSPDLNHGRNDLIALLFDMNKLWEEYVFKMLLRKVGDQWTVKGQAFQAFWETKVIKPDIVLTHLATKKQIILDTKWKIVLDGKPSDDDLKQMFAYNIYWNSVQSILLYPKASNVEDAYGVYHKGQIVEHGCKLMFVDVLDDEGHLNREIGVEVLEGVEKENGSKKYLPPFIILNN